MINVPRVLTSFIAWKLVFNAGVQRDASRNFYHCLKSPACALRLNHVASIIVNAGEMGSELTIGTAATFGAMNAVMPRHLRIQYAGVRYHVLSRGDRREAIFRTDADRKLFLDLFGHVFSSLQFTFAWDQPLFGLTPQIADLHGVDRARGQL